MADSAKFCETRRLQGALSPHALCHCWRCPQLSLALSRLRAASCSTDYICGGCRPSSCCMGQAAAALTVPRRRAPLLLLAALAGMMAVGCLSGGGRVALPGTDPDIWWPASIKHVGESVASPAAFRRQRPAPPAGPAGTSFATGDQGHSMACTRLVSSPGVPLPSPDCLTKASAAWCRAPKEQPHPSVRSAALLALDFGRCSIDLACMCCKRTLPELLSRLGGFRQWNGGHLGIENRCGSS